MTTNPRIDTRRVAEVRQRATRCRIYTPETNYLGVACSPEQAWTEWDTSPAARLCEIDDGECWSLRISDERWFELYPPEMELPDQPGRPPEPVPGIDPDVLEEVLTELIGRHATEEVFTELDTKTQLAKLDDPLHCVCRDGDEQVTPHVLTCGVCGRAWCQRCHPTPAERCPSEYEHPAPARLRWEAGSDSGDIGVTGEQTVTLVLDDEPLLGLDLAAGTVLTWPDGETAHVMATFTRPTPRLRVVNRDAQVIPLRRAPADS